MKKICLWFLACLMIFGLVFAAPQTAKADDLVCGYALYDADSHTLTFAYGVKPEGAYELNTGRNFPEWRPDSINTVAFDPSFADARPTSTYGWFSDCTNLTEITGIEYLNISEVEFMSFMFCNCTALTSLDLTSFAIASNGKVTKVMNQMFEGCSSLTELDLSTFVMESVRGTIEMFKNCSSLKTIYVSPLDWYSDIVIYQSSKDMFAGCDSLVGGEGTAWSDSNPKNWSYAHIDGGASNPGYFTVSPNTVGKTMRASGAGKHFDVTITKDVSTGIVKATLPEGYAGWSDTNYPVLVSADYKDYVFWGYSNDGETILNDRTGATYALFFPPNVFNLFVQFRAESLTGNPNRTDLRLITSAPDITTFSKLGFELREYGYNRIISQQAWDTNSAEGNGFLQTVTGNSNGTIVTLTKDAFNSTLSGTLGLQTVVGMSNSYFTAAIMESTLKGKVFAVRPFLITLDGTKSFGASHVFRVFYDENNVPSAAKWTGN